MYKCSTAWSSVSGYWREQAEIHSLRILKDEMNATGTLRVASPGVPESPSTPWSCGPPQWLCSNFSS